jgi:two-component system, NarL family, nitrate/nitrite response regulator NarL
MATNPINIVLLDNHTLVRAGIHILIERVPGLKVAAEAGDLDQGLELIANLKPDIVLFDLNISQQPCSSIVDQLVKACEATRLIMVSGTSDTPINQQAVESGVAGVVYKTQSPETLIKAIEKVNAGEVWLERSLIANVLSRLSRNNKPKKSNPEADGIDVLSEREKEIVRLIGQGLKNKKISSQLCISETTVRHHLTSIYSKLGVSDRLELLVFAHRYGLVKQTTL